MKNHSPIFLLIVCALTSSLIAGQQPNIIFILSDDMSYRDLSCYGQERYQTPNLDRLAKDGIRFSQSYSAAAECAPARCSLMTGLHTGRSSIRTNSSARGQDNLRDEDITIAEVLKELGYNTGFTGKWGIGLPGTEGVPYKQGFDFAFGFYDQTRAHTYIPHYLRENDQILEYPENQGFDMPSRYHSIDPDFKNTYDAKGTLVLPELKDPKTYTYSENEIQKAAFRFIEQNDPSQTDKPFFLYYATQLPHGPMIIDELDEMSEPAEVLQWSREWAAMVIKLDDFVGELVEKLKDMGQYENTVIFFASDNGYSMPGYIADRGNGPNWPDDPWLKNKGPFTGGKFSVLEGGCRVPFFVSWPSKFKAAAVSEPVWLPDFFPTAVELAKGNVKSYDTDGKSLIPLLKGKNDQFESHAYLYFFKNREQALRMGPWKAYRKNWESPIQLYLVEEDTYTQRNLASAYPEVVKKIKEILDSEHVPHEWYWNPWETAEDYAAKKQKAKDTGNKLPAFRPNGMERLPWEKD